VRLGDIARTWSHKLALLICRPCTVCFRDVHKMLTQLIDGVNLQFNNSRYFIDTTSFFFLSTKQPNKKKQKTKKQKNRKKPSRTRNICLGLGLGLSLVHTRNIRGLVQACGTCVATASFLQKEQ
jgi:hypothetical protein